MKTEKNLRDGLFVIILEACTGCGICCDISMVFSIDFDDGKARFVHYNASYNGTVLPMSGLTTQEFEEVLNAMESCPEEAIGAVNG
jgi:ferredoxin